MENEQSLNDLRIRKKITKFADQLCILIPAYNEERHIEELLCVIHPFAKVVLVVDDGSRDNTREIVKRLSELRYPNVHLVRTPVNSGKGAALRLGFKEICYNKKLPKVKYIITMDADLQHDWRDIPNLVRRMEKGGADIVVGRRGLSKKEARGSMPLKRWISNAWTSGFMYLFFSIQVHDIQCGYRIYRTSLVTKMLHRLNCSRFDFETEVLFVAWSYRAILLQVPIRMIYTGKEESKIVAWKDTFRWLQLVFAKLVDPWIYSHRRLSKLTV